jgi:succinylarginine dihydrolase
MQAAREFNFDGLVGPSHNYAGLSFGNVASFSNVKSASNPKQAALQGLAKMRALAARGFAQALLPPQAAELPPAAPHRLHRHRRRRAGARLPRIAGDPGLRLFGLADVDRQRRHRQSLGRHLRRPRALHAANLNNKLHRADEHASRPARCARCSQRAPLRGARRAAVDAGLRRRRRGQPHAPGRQPRRARASSSSSTAASSSIRPRRRRKNTRPARRSKRRRPSPACTAWTPARTVFASQNPDVIDQGVFHNDVIAVGNGNVLFYHEQAFADEAAVLNQLRQAMDGVGAELAPVRVDTGEVSVADAVASYLFNSQLLTKATAIWRW